MSPKLQPQLIQNSTPVTQYTFFIARITHSRRHQNITDDLLHYNEIRNSHKKTSKTRPVKRFSIKLQTIKGKMYKIYYYFHAIIYMYVVCTIFIFTMKM